MLTHRNLHRAYSILSIMVVVLTILPVSSADATDFPPDLRLFKDINPGPNDASINMRFQLGNQLIFNADDGIHGREPWITNGTSAGTHMLKDLWPGSNSGAYDYRTFLAARWVESNGLLYFPGNGLVNGNPSYGLFVTDGTDAGTLMLAPVLPQAMAALGGSVLFLNGSDLYRTNGTTAGTVKVKGFGGDYRTVGSAMQLDGLVYFELEHGTTWVYEWWQSDGTTAGTVPAIITPRVDFLLFKGAKQLSNGMYIFGNNGRLFQTSAPGEAAQEILGDYQNIEWLRFTQDWVYFISRTGTSNHNGLMRTQGNSTGVELVDDAGDYIYEVIGDHLYYRHWDSSGRFLARAGDNLPSAEVLQPDTGTYSYGEYPESTYIAEMNNLVYFAGYQPETGLELWVSDGTPKNTHLYADLYPGTTGSYPTQLINIYGRLFFAASDGITGNEWWVIGPPDSMIYLPLINR